MFCMLKRLVNTYQYPFQDMIVIFVSSLNLIKIMTSSWYTCKSKPCHWWSFIGSLNQEIYREKLNSHYFSILLQCQFSFKNKARRANLTAPCIPLRQRNYQHQPLKSPNPRWNQKKPIVAAPHSWAQSLLLTQTSKAQIFLLWYFLIQAIQSTLQHLQQYSHQFYLSFHY